MSLAVVEKAVPDALPAIFGQQHALGTIEYGVEVDPGALERRREIVRVVGQGRAGGGSHEAAFIERADHDGLVACRIGAQIDFFIGRVAVVEIRPIAEDRGPQARHVRQRVFQRASRERAQLHQPPTCFIQSARL
jgi:hypothetical protein